MAHDNNDPFAGLIWHDAFSFGLEGQAWSDVDPAFLASRLPLRAKPELRETLWYLSLHSNGLSLGNFRSLMKKSMHAP